MNPKVRDLYKRILLVGRDYPLGLNWVRQKAKEQFFKNRVVSDEIELKRLIAYGRYQVREMQAVIMLKKYRYLKKKYGSEEEEGDEKNN